MLLDLNHSANTINYCKSVTRLETRDLDFNSYEFFLSDTKSPNYEIGLKRKCSFFRALKSELVIMETNINTLQLVHLKVLQP